MAKQLRSGLDRSESRFGLLVLALPGPCFQVGEWANLCQKEHCLVGSTLEDLEQRQSRGAASKATPWNVAKKCAVPEWGVPPQIFPCPECNNSLNALKRCADALQKITRYKVFSKRLHCRTDVHYV